MEEEEGGGIRLSKRFSDKDGEVDYKTKSGTAWSHNFLNQKPWHPLSYPNQRRKWIAEQTHSQKERRAEEVSREYAQEQEFFRQAALVSQREKEKMEIMQAVSFMYVRPPGYNAESAKAAEAAAENKNQERGEISISDGQSVDGSSNSMKHDLLPSGAEKKKSRPKDVFGRALPTEEQFDVLKNAPRLDTGVAARSKPFGVEIRNVKCLRCGNFGHQSGDRECPLKDAIMPSEENRLKRDDPLTTILAQTGDPTEPLKWELKQKPGMSPPRGGFNPDDPNQQIVAEDIFDEYGGFLGTDGIPELLTNFSSSKHKKRSSKKKHKTATKIIDRSSKREDKRRSSPNATELIDRGKGPSCGDNSDRKSKKEGSGKRLYYGDNSDRKSKKEVKDRGKGSCDGDNKDSKSKKRSKKSKRHLDSDTSENSESDVSSSHDDRRCSRKKRRKRKYGKYSESGSSDISDYDDRCKKSSRHHRQSHHNPTESSDSDSRYRSKRYHSSRH